jgi:hypothetical protein
LDGIHAHVEAGVTTISQCTLAVCTRNRDGIRAERGGEGCQWARSVRLLAFACWLLAACLHPLQAQEDDPQWQRHSVGVFAIEYHAIDRGFAMIVADAVEVSRRRLAEELGLREFRNSRIVVAFDPAQFYRLCGPGFPHWGGACANPEGRLIVLKSPRWGDIGRGDIGATVRHEMTHLGVGILRRGQWIPTWLEEGLAVVQSGLPRGLAEGTGSQVSISRALHTGSLLELDDLESLHGYGNLPAELAYLQAESAVRYFIERYGRVALIQLLTHVGRGVEFREAFDRVTGGGWFRFEEDWRAWLKSNSAGYFLLDFASWVWLGIIPLAIAAWGVRRWRARRILAAWREEDADEL